MPDSLKLTRELRFGFDHAPTNGPGRVISEPLRGNGFAGNPGLTGPGIFLLLRATLEGPVDPPTGMLLNIRDIDHVLRETAVARIRNGLQVNESAPHILLALAAQLHDAFAPQRLDALELWPSPYLCFAHSTQEPRMVKLSLRFEFSAAHRLHAATLSDDENRELFGRCNNPNGHGHNYELEVTVQGQPDDRGQVVSIADLQRVVNDRVIHPFDHKHLNLDCPDFAALNPTVENIARVIWTRLHGHVPGNLARIKIWETPKTVCEYAG